jgi:lysophospholipase L1-like esterase
MLIAGPVPMAQPAPTPVAVTVRARPVNAPTVLGQDRMANTPNVNPPSATPVKKPRVVFFGSSTTEGAGASRRDRRYSSLLSQYLGWEEINAGKGGSRLTNQGQGHQGVPPSAVMRWQKDVADKHPDRIVLMYGANDMHKRVPMSDFEPAVADLLGHLKGVVGPGNLVVSTTQPVLKTAGDRSLYDAALKKGAHDAGSAFVDPGHCVAPGQLAEYSHDNWHLNDLGHAELASYLAAQLTDQGWAPKASAATGGNALTGTVAPMAAATMLVDDTTPLAGGELKHIEARFTGSGTAVLGVVRPNAAGGFDLVYKTNTVAAKAGTTTLDVPRWRVLQGDRLAVWADGAIVAGSAATPGRTLAVATDRKKPLRDLKKDEASPTPHAVGLRAIP